LLCCPLFFSAVDLFGKIFNACHIREFGEFSHGPSEKFLLLIQADFLGILEGA